MISSTRTRGVIEIILSGICFGFLGLFGKAAYERGLSPGELLSFRFLIGGVLLFSFFLTFQPRKIRLSKMQFLHCSVLGTFGYAIFSFCFFSALQTLSASMTVILLYTYPILVALMGWLLFKEKIPVKNLPAIPFCFLGLVLLIGGHFEVTEMGSLLFGIGSAVFYAFYILYSRHFLKGANPYVSGSIIMLVAGCVLSLFHLRVERIFPLLVENWAFLTIGTLVCTVAAMSLFLAGLQKLPSWEASLLSTFEPVTGVALAIFVLHESLEISQWLGIALIGLGFYFISRSTSDRQNQQKM